MRAMKDCNWFREFNDKAIMFGYRGSQAHGTYRPNTDPNSIDDIDLMGVIIQPVEAYFGFGAQETFERMEDPWDVVVYDIRKFISLLVKQNPNVLSMLWLPPNMYTKLAPSGQLLIDNRGVFVSKEAYKSFTGYAYSQLKKMTHGVFEGYMGEKRKRLVEKFGFDTKNAAHLIRLLKMGIEYLATGQLNVMREDNTYLVDIKNGKYSLEYIQKEAERLFQLAEMSLVNSKLQDVVDRKKAEGLLVDILSSHFGLPGSRGNREPFNPWGAAINRGAVINHDECYGSGVLF